LRPSLASAVALATPIATPPAVGRLILTQVAAMPEVSKLERPLAIFVMHASDMLTDYLPHGDGLIAWNFIRGLAMRGHEIHVAVTRVEIHGEIPANVHLHRIEAGAAMFGRLQYMYRMRVLFEQLQREVPFDVALQMNPVFTGISLAMLFCGVPVVLGTYVASWPAEEIKATMTDGIAPGSVGQKVLAALQQLGADRLLLTVPAAMSRLPLRGWMKRKVRWVAHGIDTDMFSPAVDAFSERRMQAEQAHPTVLFVANIVKRKGIDPLVRAWAKVAAQMPEARLSVVGNGPDLPGMRALAEELGVTDSIHFRGAAKREAVPRLLQDHAVYVLPSFGEPYAGSLLEAMSCGRPVVITNAGGLPEMVPQDGGLRVPTHDADALAAAMLAMLRDPEMRRHAGEVNRQMMVTKMTWSRVLDTLETHYGELLDVPLRF
jgi:L-malate glycosyltransferase